MAGRKKKRGTSNREIPPSTSVDGSVSRIGDALLQRYADLLEK
jgi:hypothetical protein